MKKISSPSFKIVNHVDIVNTIWQMLNDSFREIVWEISSPLSFLSFTKMNGIKADRNTWNNRNTISLFSPVSILHELNISVREIFEYNLVVQRKYSNYDYFYSYRNSPLIRNIWNNSNTIRFPPGIESPSPTFPRGKFLLRKVEKKDEIPITIPLLSPLADSCTILIVYSYQTFLS